MTSPPRTTLAATLLALATLAGCGAGTSVVESKGDAPASASPSPAAAQPGGTPALPDGWRWESYRGVQVGVPDDWTWINGSQRASQWCVGDGTTPPATGIGRPGGATLVGCSEGEGPSPGTLIKRNGVFAAFEQAEFNKAGVEGDRLTIHLGDVAILIQAEPELRKQIAATAHEVEIDANGCPKRDEVTDTPSLKPSPAVALDELSGVRSVSACLYALKEGSSGPGLDGPSLSSSIRMTGDAAARVMHDLAEAPAAAGQDNPESCTYKYGSEMVVLLVESASGPSRVHIRFSGCDHNAVDDGASPRRLTPAVQPFFSGGNRPTGFSGGADKAEAVMGVKDGRVPKPSAPPVD